MTATLASGGSVANAGDLTTEANVQSWLSLGSTVDTAVIGRLVSAQSTFIQNWLQRQIASAQYTEVRDGSGMGAGRYEMVLANYPITSVASLTVDGLPIPMSSDNGVEQPGYGFDSYRIFVAQVGSVVDAMYSNQYYFNRGRANVTVVYTAGFAQIPYDIEQACIELVALRYSERTRIGLASKGLAGETTAFQQKALTDSILQSLQQYRRVVPL